ncbi:MAG: hypothetical protein IJ134_04355 [Bacilli bacterium]|nr:hypothetical protein [Bacilli bacterium]
MLNYKKIICSIAICFMCFIGMNSVMAAEVTTEKLAEILRESDLLDALYFEDSKITFETTDTTLKIHEINGFYDDEIDDVETDTIYTLIDNILTYEYLDMENPSYAQIVPDELWTDEVIKAIYTLKGHENETINYENPEFILYEKFETAGQPQGTKRLKIDLSKIEDLNPETTSVDDDNQSSNVVESTENSVSNNVDNKKTSSTTENPKTGVYGGSILLVVSAIVGYIVIRRKNKFKNI